MNSSDILTDGPSARVTVEVLGLNTVEAAAAAAAAVGLEALPGGSKELVAPPATWSNM